MTKKEQELIDTFIDRDYDQLGGNRETYRAAAERELEELQTNCDHTFTGRWNVCTKCGKKKEQ